ncbi:MAG: hypothetical protein JNK89_05630, partial [Saprospiraceae bacterium]|nr:hypothetical protein [Saprospiraceae bacterium]
MNVLAIPRAISLSLLVSALLLSSFGHVFSQNSSPLKSLIATKNQAVTDTVSGLNMSIYAVSPLPKNGTVNIVLIQPGGSGNPHVYTVKYTPDPGFTGVDTFTVEINYQGSYPYLIYRGYRVSVYPALVRPKDDFSVTTTGAPITRAVLDNDSGAGPLSLSAIAQVKNGTASIVGGDSIRFTPSAGYTGMAYVQYVACDTAGNCKTAQWAIGVNNNTAPPPDTLRAFTAKNTPLTMPLRHAGYSLFQAPASGTVNLL